MYKDHSIHIFKCKLVDEEKAVCEINILKYMHSAYLLKETEFDSPLSLYRQNWCW